MATQVHSNSDKARKKVVSSYRRQGYRVSASPSPEALPSFLQGSHPDVIAERADDHVVVEVKRAGSLKGANDLVDLAQRVATQPGWRLELVTFEDADPDALVVTADWLERMLRQPYEKSDSYNPTFAASYRLEVLGFMLRGLALRADLSVKGKTPSDVAHNLAFEGVIDGPLLARIGSAIEWQMELMRGRTPTPPAEQQTAELESICRELYRQVLLLED